jgi:hypothetical protein
MPLPVRRVVHERDGDQCGFLDGNGRRCTERRHLEFHHLDPFARGGARDPARVALRCKLTTCITPSRTKGKT